MGRKHSTSGCIQFQTEIGTVNNEVGPEKTRLAKKDCAWGSEFLFLFLFAEWMTKAVTRVDLIYEDNTRQRHEYTIEAVGFTRRLRHALSQYLASQRLLSIEFV